MIPRVFVRACIVTAATSLICAFPDATAAPRTWTSKFGSRSVEGEFVELKAGRLTLRKPDGATFNLPVSALIDDDQAAATGEQARIDSENRVSVLESLKDRMIRIVDGKAEKFQFSTERAPTHVLFYVVSSLCDTCMAHAPRLKNYHEETLASAPEIELVVISLDSDKETQLEYLAGQRLPFPAVEVEAMPLFEAAITPRIFSRATEGCQTFILTTIDGKILSKSALEPKREIAEILKGH